MILPILTHGSEIWGYQMYTCIETIHYNYCKYFLGVKRNTPNAAVLGELGRTPIFIYTFIRCVKWWFKLLSMSNDRIAKHSYILLCREDQRGKVNWVTHIRNILNRYGFGHVWINQGVGNERKVIVTFRNRIMDNRKQDL